MINRLLTLIVLLMAWLILGQEDLRSLLDLENPYGIVAAVAAAVCVAITFPLFTRGWRLLNPARIAWMFACIPAMLFSLITGGIWAMRTAFRADVQKEPEIILIRSRLRNDSSRALLAFWLMLVPGISISEINSKGVMKISALGGIDKHKALTVIEGIETWIERVLE